MARKTSKDPGKSSKSSKSPKTRAGAGKSTSSRTRSKKTTSSRTRSPKRASRGASGGSLLGRLRSLHGKRGGAIQDLLQGAHRGSSSGRATTKRTSQDKSTSTGKTPVASGLSLDRKLDIIGVVSVLIGLLTLLSLLSTSRSSVTGQWVAALRLAFGWGMYVFPFGLLLGGLWLILRNFERIPQVAVERLLGIGLLFLNVLAWAHFAITLTSPLDTFELAQQGLGGGYLGAWLAHLLLLALGRGGTAVALGAWLLIALALTLDLTVLELFAWIPPLFAGFFAAVTHLTSRLQFRRRTREEDFSDFIPMPEGATDLAGIEGTVAGVSASQMNHGPLDPSMNLEHRAWVLPPLDAILDQGDEVNYDDEVDRERAQVIEETLSSFGAPARVVEINRGPTITQFGVEPDFVESRSGRTRVRVSKISSLADDLALALAARTIRIQAPVPGKSYVGIEVPNEEIARVALRDVLESEAFKRLKSPLRFALGQNVAGMAVAADLSAMPHLLIAGQTGSGKSVCVNALISCLLLNNTPDELRLIMVDPKRVELTGYNGIPHLLAPVVVEMEKVVSALQWVTREMDMRYRKLSEAGARNIQDYNNRAAVRGGQKLPYLVVIVDELADLMMLAPDETERALTRLAQLARATGIHLVIATQRPSVDVVTGLIKANFPARIAFAVASQTDSRVILDQPGADRLLGQGDMLFQAPDAPAPVRLQGVFVAESETQRLVHYWRGFAGTRETAPVAVGGIVDALPSNIPLKQLPMWDEVTADEIDPLLNEAIDLVRRQGRASISMLQRRMRIGYTRSARLIEEMEARGIVSEPEPSTGNREVLDYGPAAPPVGE